MMALQLKGVGFITGAASGKGSCDLCLPVVAGSPCFLNTHTRLICESGIGRATAHCFAKHGVRRLAIGDLNRSGIRDTAAGLVEKYPDLEILQLELNTTVEGSVQDAVSSTCKHFGRIDYAVNNAGIGGQAIRSADSKLVDWQKTVDVNLTGVWLCARAQIREMLKQDVLEKG
jgi:NAD(P)-dependent dehydrogenase (short-subunit alcohol dehydrogenase family)